MLFRSDRIILADQNTNPVDLTELNSVIEVKTVGFDAQVHSLDGRQDLIHIVGMRPSVTRAKNVALKWAAGEGLLFLDDDVELDPGSIGEVARYLMSHPEVSFIGGRETVVPAVLARSAFRTALVRAASLVLPAEKDYSIDGHYVGRVKRNSFFLCDYSLKASHPVRIDTARGCVWATRRVRVEALGGFDEFYQGTALREESDLHLRLQDRFGPAYYLPQVHVRHYRQLGGCNNLKQSLAVLESKLTNEAYFQQKHFSQVSKFWFLIRLLPLVLSNLKSTYGYSLLLLIRYTWFFKKSA